ncbi:MAG: 50S ribosomal protein L6 [Armatimonadota bacterium]|nr:50S ribosomal protein L6 [Armatimonadota bacterium]
MSRIGNLPINLPQGVEINIDQSKVTVKGPKGVLSRELHRDMAIRVDDGKIVVERPTDNKMHRSLHGLTRTLVANMVEGVTNGYQKVLQVIGVGYRAQLNGQNLNLQIGYSHPVEIIPKSGIEFEVGQDTNTRMPFIIVRGIDKEVVGQQAAEIRKVRPPEPYKGKGIKYSTEIIRRKAGKAGKAGAGK